MRRDGWTQDEDQVLQEMYGKFNYDKMLERLPRRTKSAIACRATKLGLKGDVKVTMSQASRKYDVNFEFFSSLNISSIAFAGLIASDGAIIEEKNAIRISLKIEDGYLLEKWAEVVGYTGPLGEYANKNSEYSPGCKSKLLFIHGVPQWLKQLDKIYNITPRKSLTLMPPNLYEKEHILAFMAGYIDGDGSISFRVIKKTDKKSGKVYGQDTWTVVFCGTREMCIWFKAQCDRFYPPKKPYSGLESKEKKNGLTWQFRVNGERALLLLQDILNLDLPRLVRKWSKPLEYLQKLPPK